MEYQNTDLGMRDMMVVIRGVSCGKQTAWNRHDAYHGWNRGS